ncbi:hypothetical protein [Clostridium sp. FP1]|uniref:XkdQ/YqbQ family protein n=1 Tax=Clostridium sp. FP1 TaxID=2724076 RepID=UPI0013E97E44|nr:hypothetical protein [Clostridium sp. FP1]MBZ9633196.1 hypothetical protein [Clostridium sp. FP1]
MSKYELSILAGGGKWIDALPRSNSISWGSDKDTLGVELSFTSLFDLTEGNTHVKFKINNRPTFNGVVVKKIKNKTYFSYVCFDYAWYINKNETIIQFNKINASDAIEQLCSKFGVKCDVVKIDYTVQEAKKVTVKTKVDKTIKLKSGKTKVAKRVVKTKITTLISKIYKDMTISAIIEDILEQAEHELGIKFIKEMIGDILYIRKQIEYKLFPTFLISDDLTVNSSIENMKNKVIVVSSDEKNNKILATALDSKNIKSYGSFQEVISVEQKDESKAKNIANNFLKANNKIFKDTTINLIIIDGGEEIRANRSVGVNIKSMGLNGWYNIKSCSNSLINNQQKCSLTLEW